jgi:hypothetical protein
MEPTTTYHHQQVLLSPLPLTTQRFAGQPITNSEIDAWLEANRADSSRSDVLLPGYLHMNDVPSDQVLCTVVATVGEVCIQFNQSVMCGLSDLLQYIDEVYQDRHVVHHLWIAVGVPEQSGISSISLASPLAALATFVIVSADVDTPKDTLEDVPKWTRDMVPRCPLVFRQPRGPIAELFSALAFWYKNNIIVSHSSTFQSSFD